MDASTNARHETVMDVGSQRVARVYAEALLDNAKKTHEEQALLEELEALVGDVFQRQPTTELFFSSAAIGRDRKAAVLQSALAPNASQTFTNFLLVLNEHDRLDLLRPILAAYRELLDELFHRVRVQVRSAVPLTEAQQERLKEILRGAGRRREPILDLRVDPSLLGGLVVKVGDYLYDTSVRSRLATIENHLIESSSHEIQSGRDRFSSLA